MKRRKFIEYIAVAAVSATATPAFGKRIVPVAFEFDSDDSILKLFKPSRAPQIIEKQFWDLFGWLKTKGWHTYLTSVTNLHFDVSADALATVFAKPLNNMNNFSGLDDFAGMRLIEPGRPSMSLLYHVLASPRVKPVLDGSPMPASCFPSLEQLDILENYIYAQHVFQYPLDRLPDDFVLAMFSYEYRPAFKTPDDSPYADHVFSRTGIARIGDQQLSYDASKRCFTNKPQDPEANKCIAVTPARYGLFLAKKLRYQDVNLYSAERRDYHGIFPFATQRSFLQPIRKIFDGDEMIGGANLVFHESHINEQLEKLDRNGGVVIPAQFKRGQAPFVKTNRSHVTQGQPPQGDGELISLRTAGSSVLVSPVPAPLVKKATQNGKIVYFQVDKIKGGDGFKSDRRYTSLKLLNKRVSDIADFVLTEGIYPKYKATRFSAPRNAPMFVNIRNRMINSNSTTENLGAETKDFEALIKEGGYNTALFEDNICEGCVTAVITGQKLKVLPAFSLSTAPDFFPLSDSYDLTDYDERGNSSFLEGGVENLSYCRLGPNPAIQDPVEDSVAFPFRKTTNTPEYEQNNIAKGEGTNLEYEVSDTMLAIVSSVGTPTNTSYKAKEIYKQPKMRDYHVNSFLSDTSAFVFAPGWEATYSSGDDPKRVFLATFGLGSPFPEDMKLCAAANGMWPVASPDAARTFQGSLEPLPTPKKLKHILDQTVPPTAIPLMDLEIGIHPEHPGVAEAEVMGPSFGWDGEQGPFLIRAGDEFKVHFTDIGRADYVENLIGKSAPGFNMSRLRELTCTQLVERIECLRKCKELIEGEEFRYSKYWLVSAEEVADWRTGAQAIGIPKTLVGQDKAWATISRLPKNGSGFLYVFVDPYYEFKRTPDQYQWTHPDSKRRLLNLKNIYVCQVTKEDLVWCVIPPTGKSSPAEVQWNNGKG
ncbi:hypothetical protein SNE26_24640 [Mucilaginibacter sp. cycad4]|uniref:hypothetical protein n=1 Tax=Mucilaginibacter sp. cycad4 TaxID=3342096 RepID=UPI002AABBD7A|nr:hypothetical protein [Mucilaginibacter gossypii]WPU99205.1 hypothetical protein SNE26_24640 [Mucilaginibacter gossypii]